MKVFISWSGEFSRRVAEILKKYLPLINHDVKPFLSSRDISSGSRWPARLTDELKSTNFGILCITSQNINEPWLLFEAGALSKFDDSSLCGLLLGDLKISDVKGPLAQFQHRRFTELDINTLLKDINDKTEKKLASEDLNILFEKFWPDIIKDYEKYIQEDLIIPKSRDVRIFAKSEDSDFYKYFSQLVSNAKHITLVGTGLNIIQSDTIREEAFKRAKSGECELKIYLADPESPAVESRLIEEELGKTKPRVGYEGLCNHLESMLQDWNDLDCPENLILYLFSNYPTFALLIVDDNYFIYPYGYATLGNFSPVLQFSGHSPNHKDFINFLDEHRKLIEKRAQRVEHVFKYRKRKGHDLNELHSFALFFIPAEDSNFYRYGSNILGYDIRRKRKIESQWADLVGTASDYGFHLTICDVLYFLNENEMKYAMKEVEYLTKQISCFSISGLQLKTSFPNQTSISIAIDDPSGSLEALHHEIVHRVYRRSVASNYTLKLAKLDRDEDLQRAKLMINRYRAPYILKRYSPHFTLLTNVESQEMSLHREELERDFPVAGEKSIIDVDRIAVMSRPSPNDLWVIEEELPLK